MSLIIKKNTTFKIPRTGSGAPTTLPLSTPNIYISGLTFTDNNPSYRGAFIGNPYIRQSNTFWASSTGGSLIYGDAWYIYCGCEEYFSEDDAWFNAAVPIAINSSSFASIPLTGWTLDQSIFTVAGTVIISTTP